MSTICWLHLSDWHQKSAKLDGDRAFVLKRLIEDLAGREKLNPLLSRLDFVVFSGDLAFSGKQPEYELAASNFLDPVLKAAGVGKESLFLVPGNHDLNQDKLLPLKSFFDLLPDRDHVHNALSNEEDRQVYLGPMQGYVNFCKSYLASHAPPEPAYSQLREFDVRGKKIAILGLNSAWMCGQKKEGTQVNDYGYLILGEPQLNQHFDLWRSADVRFAVMHHPFEWFSMVEDRGRLRRALTRSCHFLLRGHEHDPEVSVPTGGTSGSYAVLSAGAAYDRRENPFRPNGYNFVYIDLEQGQGTAYLRKYDSEQRKFIADSSVTGDETPGIATFVLPTGLRKTEPQQQKKPAQTLVGDLWAVQNPATMSDISEIYRVQHAGSPFERISATLIVQAHSLRDETEPDLVTLEQVFKPLDDPLYCIKLSLFSSCGDFLGQSKWQLYNEQTKEPLRTIALPIYEAVEAVPGEPPGTRPPARSLVIHFDPVLRPATGPYRLEYREFVRNGMSNLRSGRDEMFVYLSRGRDSIPSVNLVLQVPKEFGAVEMELSPKTDPANPGELMNDKERSGYDVPGFYTIGWKGAKVRSNALFAVNLVKPTQQCD